MQSIRRRLGRISLFALGLFLVLIDYLKSGGSITSHLPQTPAWDGVNSVAFVVESFLGYNIGRLLPWHVFGVLGLGMGIAAAYLWRRRSAPPADTYSGGTPVQPDQPATRD